MVNVQNVREFVCQVLNRDVWSDPRVKAIVKENFIFWQVNQPRDCSGVSDKLCCSLSLLSAIRTKHSSNLLLDAALLTGLCPAALFPSFRRSCNIN